MSKKPTPLNEWLKTSQHGSRHSTLIIQKTIEAFIHGEIIYDYHPRDEDMPSMKFSIQGSHGVKGLFTSFIVIEHED